MQIVDTAAFVTLKYLAIGTAIAYLTVIAVHLLKCLFYGKRKAGPHMATGKIMIPLIAVCFLGLSIAFILLGIGTHRLAVYIANMEADGEYTRSDFPEEQFYFGYLDLSDRFVKLKDLLKAKCDSVSELNIDHLQLRDPLCPYAETTTRYSHSTVLLGKRSDIPLSSDFFSSKIAGQLNKISRVVFELVGGCTDEEKDYLIKSCETINYIQYIQKRFFNTVHTISGDAEILVWIQMASAPVLIATMFYLIMKYRKDYVEMANEECKNFGMIMARSHAAIILFLIMIAVLFFVLLQFVPLLNATINIEEVYERKILSKPRPSVNSAERQKEKIDFIKSHLQLLSSKIDAALKAEHNPNKSNVKAAADIVVIANEGESPESETLISIVSKRLALLGRVVDLQDDIDSLAVEINNGILKSDMRHLMRVHLTDLSSRLWNGICLSAFIAIYFAFGALGLHIIQILLNF